MLFEKSLQMIDCLYLKIYQPKNFWKSTLKNTETSYRKWVHYFEAKINGVDFKDIIQNNE